MTNPVKKIITQIRREYWEHKIIMLWLPVGITVITLLLQTYAVFTSGGVDHSAISATESPSNFSFTYKESFTKEDIVGGVPTESTTTKTFVKTQNFTASEFLLRLLGRNDESGADSPLEAMLIGFAFPIIALLILSLLIYCHSCLYGDRARKEVLFWRSMPVSESQNLLCKLLVITIVIPTIYCLMILVYGAGALVLQNADGASWFRLALDVSQFTLTGILFTLAFIPLISWILFCSAAAKKAPIFLSLLLPLALGMVFKFSLGKNYITASISHYFTALWSQVKPGPEIQQQIFGFFASTEFLTAFALSALLLLAAVWLRNHRYEI